MRDSKEVMEKFEEVRAAKLRERKQAFLDRIFVNCASNVRMRVKGKGQVGFCQNKAVLARSRKGLFVCNDDETAATCPDFVCRNTEESVMRDFDEIMKSPARCGHDYPKLAMLIWFLQEFEVQGRWAKLRSLCGKVSSSAWGVVSLRWW
jgi:hypothetical protein